MSGYRGGLMDMLESYMVALDHALAVLDKTDNEPLNSIQAKARAKAWRAVEVIDGRLETLLVQLEKS